MLPYSFRSWQDICHQNKTFINDDIMLKSVHIRLISFGVIGQQILKSKIIRNLCMPLHIHLYNHMSCNHWPFPYVLWTLFVIRIYTRYSSFTVGILSLLVITRSSYTKGSISILSYKYINTVAHPSRISLYLFILHPALCLYSDLYPMQSKLK